MNVLIVDDEDGMRSMLAFELAGKAHEISTAENGLKGLRAAQERDFDIIITDIKMPEMDGIALLTEVKKRKPKTEVIVMTGFGTAETETTALREGAYAFIRKPFMLDAMRNVLEKCVAKINKDRAADPALPPKMVLVVDDEPGIQQLIKFELEAGDYAVLSASNGKEAVETVTHTTLVAVLLDLGLPDVNGFEVLAQIKKIKPSVPVVILTGLSDETNARKAMNMGAIDYLVKPIDFNYLKNLLLSQLSS